MLALKLAARALKATLVIPQEQLAGFDVPNGVKAVDFHIALEDGMRVFGTLNAKSLRRAIATACAGPTAIIIQGKLGRDGTLAECGIQAMTREEKAA